MLFNKTGITMVTIPSSETCQACGQCCRNHPYILLSESDLIRLEKVAGMDRGEFTHKNDDTRFLAFKENGDCIFLKGNAGSYHCGVYEGRGELCRNYPSNDVQKERCNQLIKQTSKNTK